MRYCYVLHRQETVLQIFHGLLPCGTRGLNGVISVHLRPFLRIQAKNTLASVRMCTHSHGPSLVETALSINI